MAYSLSTQEYLENLEVTLDGERLFADYARSRSNRWLCAILCSGIRLTGLGMLVGAAILNVRGDGFGGFYMSVCGLGLLFGGLIGLRPLQNAPVRITLNGDSLRYRDTYTGEMRSFPRDACLKVCCGRSDGICSIFVMSCDDRMELLVGDLPREIVPELVRALNIHLCQPESHDADTADTTA